MARLPPPAILPSAATSLCHAYLPPHLQGDVFGELALLPTPHALRKMDPELRRELLAGSRWRSPFTAVALDRCELLELPADAFHRLAANHPDVLQELEEDAERCACGGA